MRTKDDTLAVNVAFRRLCSAGQEMEVQHSLADAILSWPS